ncbi:hypothetical protein RJ639_015618, partial [Escallonia herrerae]
MEICVAKHGDKSIQEFYSKTFLDQVALIEPKDLKVLDSYATCRERQRFHPPLTHPLVYSQRKRLLSISSVPMSDPAHQTDNTDPAPSERRWEGFIHVALHHWDQKNLRHDTATSSLSWSLDVAAVNLIHVAVKVLGCNDPTFRKACMVGAISLPLVTEGWLNINQRTIFKQLLTKISTESSFLDTVKSVEAAIQKREDPFQDLKWLQHLNKKGKASERHIRVENLFDLVNQQKDKAEVAFMDAKSRFCKEVEFEDVQQNYMVLLEKYRTARNQYKNGMLSLHWLKASLRGIWEIKIGKLQQQKYEMGSVESVLRPTLNFLNASFLLEDEWLSTVMGRLPGREFIRG